MKKMRLQPKLLFGLLIMAVVLMLALTPTISRMYRSHMEEQYSKTAFDMATIAAGLIDGDRIAYYRETQQKDEYYEQVRQELQLIRDTVGLKYFYVVIPETSQFYIWDTGEEGDDGVCDLGDLDQYWDDGYEIMQSAFKANAEKVILITNSEEYGYLASAYVAIIDSYGRPAALASVDVSLDEINDEIRTFVTTLVVIAAAVLCLSSIVYYFYIRKILIKPIFTLHKDTEKLVSDQMEGLDTFRNKVKTGDELEELGKSFEFMTHELSDYITNLSLVTAEKERIGAELNIAAQIQADMLPRLYPAFPEREEFDLYASMTPAKEVGGDFYDFFLIDEDHIGLVMADVSGKGVPAALFMVIAKTLIKNQAQICDYSPAKILMSVNEQLCEGNEAELFVTVWLAIIQISTGKGLAANAGHEHPVIRRAGGQHELVIYRHSPAVATMEGTRFREHPFELHPGDSLFVYTDGVPEACNADNEFFGTARMLEALNAAPDLTPKELLFNVRKAIDDFVGKAPRFDDITMMCFKYCGTEGKGKELTVDATDENLQKVLAFVDQELKAVGCSEKTQMQIDVAVEELFVNIAHYAYAPETGSANIWVKTQPEPKSISITFLDRGVPYNPLDKPDPDVTLSAEERKIGGLGIYMVKKSMDNVLYEHRDGQNVLTIVKSLD